MARLRGVRERIHQPMFDTNIEKLSPHGRALYDFLYAECAGVLPLPIRWGVLEADTLVHDVKNESDALVFRKAFEERVRTMHTFGTLNGDILMHCRPLEYVQNSAALLGRALWYLDNIEWEPELTDE